MWVLTPFFCALLIPQEAILHHLVSSPPSRDTDHLGGDIPTHLLALLQAESQVFMEDLCRTEALLRPHDCSLMTSASALAAIPPTDTAPPSTSAGASGAKSNETAPTVPVDELVMATHVSLLIKVLSDTAKAVLSSSASTGTCTTITASATVTTLVGSSGMKGGHRYRAAAESCHGSALVNRRRHSGHDALQGVANVVDRLPRGSWWLPKRIFKAYISLQHQVEQTMHVL